MSTYKITFINENGKIKNMSVKETGIIPAICKAIRQSMGKAWNVGHFWYPIKAEELNIKNSTIEG